MSRANYPVTQVDWCDAWGYCAAAGKHLCGRIGGGNTLQGYETGDAKKSEWYSACSKGGAQTYPYPGQYAGGRCVDRNIQSLRQVATSTFGRTFYPHRYRQFTHGYYSVNGRHLYVNRGLSYGQRVLSWCRPEITVLKLEAPGEDYH